MKYIEANYWLILQRKVSAERGGDERFLPLKGLKMPFCDLRWKVMSAK